MRISRLMILGFVAGVVLGMGDYLILRALSVSMLVDGKDYTFEVVLLFALNFGALGAVIARLWEQRTSMAEQAEMIGRQYQELKNMQDALVQNETMAAMGRMSAGVAHEVRNPLSIIRSSAQMLSEDLEGESADAAEFICNEVDRLDDFVTRVLDFSKRVHVELEDTTWAVLSKRMAQLDAKIAGPEDMSLEVDAELMTRIVANLVDNARRSAGADAEIVVRAHEAGIEVVDDGPGVPIDSADQIFEPFFTTRAQGTGLGLAMARKLAEVQGWNLKLVPSQSGARFRLEPASQERP